MILSLNISSNITEHLLYSWHCFSHWEANGSQKCEEVNASPFFQIHNLNSWSPGLQIVTVFCGGLKKVIKIKWGHEDGP